MLSTYSANCSDGTGRCAGAFCVWTILCDDRQAETIPLRRKEKKNSRWGRMLHSSEWIQLPCVVFALSYTNGTVTLNKVTAFWVMCSLTPWRRRSPLPYTVNFKCWLRSKNVRKTFLSKTPVKSTIKFKLYELNSFNNWNCYLLVDFFWR